MSPFDHVCIFVFCIIIVLLFLYYISASLPRYVNLLTASTWCPDMTQEGGEGPEATYWILVFAQDVWKPIVFAAVSNDSKIDGH